MSCHGWSQITRVPVPLFIAAYLCSRGIVRRLHVYPSLRVPANFEKKYPDTREYLRVVWAGTRVPV